jgi:hypothetical protein
VHVSESLDITRTMASSWCYHYCRRLGVPLHDVESGILHMSGVAHG